MEIFCSLSGSEPGSLRLAARLFGTTFHVILSDHEFVANGQPTPVQCCPYHSQVYIPENDMDISRYIWIKMEKISLKYLCGYGLEVKGDDRIFCQISDQKGLTSQACDLQLF